MASTTNDLPVSRSSGREHIQPGTQLDRGGSGSAHQKLSGQWAGEYRRSHAQGT